MQGLEQTAGEAAGTASASPVIRLRCTGCGRTVTTPAATGCTACGASLAVDAQRDMSAAPSGHDGLWRYAARLLPLAASSRVTLAEGGTPLLDAPSLAAEIGVDRLLLKDDSRNPTGTFKDRCLAVGASVAVESAAPGLVCASTGNAGASTAAYAARAGLPAIILVPRGTAPSKLAQALIYGAQPLGVEGTYSDAYGLAGAAAEVLGYINTTTTFVSPYTVEGARTLGYELQEQLPEPPDWVVVPIGAGPLLVAIHDAYLDLKGAGRAGRVPKLLAVQPAGCAPIVRAFLEGAETATAWDSPATRVQSLADPLQGYEHEAGLTLAAIRQSGGSAVAVADTETLAWVQALGRQTGLFAEPGAAITLAGLAQAVREETVKPGETVVCCLTGTGLKDPFAAVPDVEPPVVPATRDALLGWLTDQEARLGRG